MSVTDEMVDLVLKATNKRMRQQRAVLLAEACRDDFTELRPVLDALLSAQRPVKERGNELGRLAVELARLEFLLGWLHAGGVLDKKNKWEPKDDNDGEFPDTYQDRIFGGSRQKGHAWCICFAGFLYERLGFDFRDGPIAGRGRAMFRSGYKMEQWARKGEAAGKVITPPGERLVDPTSAGFFVREKFWRGLHDTLKEEPPDLRIEAVKGELGRIGKVPQPGDLLILGRAGNRYKRRPDTRFGSHTTIVEHYDPDTAILHTIEGNTARGVSSRRISLAEPGDATTILFLVRLGADQFSAPDITPDNLAFDKLSKAIRDLQTLILSHVENTGDPGRWFKSTASEALVHDWFKGGKGKSADKPTPTPAPIVLTPVVAPITQGKMEETYDVEELDLGGFKFQLWTPDIAPGHSGVVDLDVYFHGAPKDSTPDVLFQKMSKRFKGQTGAGFYCVPYNMQRLVGDRLMGFLSALQGHFRALSFEPRFSFSGHSRGAVVLVRRNLIVDKEDEERTAPFRAFFKKHHSSLRLLDPVFFDDMTPEVLAWIEKGHGFGMVWGHLNNPRPRIERLVKRLRKKVGAPGDPRDILHLPDSRIMVQYIRNDLPWHDHGSAPRALPFLSRHTLPSPGADPNV